MAKKKSAGTEVPTFEEALARLEKIVHELEETDLPLERSLAVFEEGVRLSRLLHERLNEAERKVEILMKSEDGGKVAMPFAAADEVTRGVATESEDTEEGEAEDDAGDGAVKGGSRGGHGQSALPF